LRIGIAGIALEIGDAGYRRYFQQLTRGLAAGDSRNEYVLFLNEAVYESLQVNQTNFENVRIHVPFQGATEYRVSLAWEQIYLPYISVQKNLDVLHASVSALPLLARANSVLTVYDLMHMVLPGTQRKMYRLYWRLFMSLSVKIAKRIVAISESTKHDLIRFYPVSQGKVEVIYPWLAPGFRRTDDHVRAIAKYGLPNKYVLYVGTLTARKNLSSLIRAYARARKEGPIEHRLVLIGKREAPYDDIMMTVRELGLERDVIFGGYAPDEDLPELYSGADLFAYVSSYEGFGLPVLEAMACGVPALTSNVSSLPEVVGDAGITVAPWDVERMASEMVRVLRDRDWHEELVKRGLQRAEQFSREASIRQMLRLYEGAAVA